MKKVYRWVRSFLTIPAKSPRLNSPAYDTLVEAAQTKYNNGIQTLKDSQQIHRYAWRYDAKTHKLHFRHKKQTLPDLCAKAQIIGSYFKRTKTFEWSWNTPNVPKKTTKAARKTRTFGRCHGQPLLYTGALQSRHELKNCHYYAAMTLYLNNGHSVYQGESRDQIVFFFIEHFVQ